MFDVSPTAFLYPWPANCSVSHVRTEPKSKPKQLELRKNRDTTTDIIEIKYFINTKT